MKPRFLLDEHVNRAIRHKLGSRGAREHDESFHCASPSLPCPLAPQHYWIRPGVGIGRIIEELHLIWFASTAGEYQDRLLFIPL